MPAYYDGQLYTINFMELPAGGETATLAQNKSINTIYMSDPGDCERRPLPRLRRADVLERCWLYDQVPSLQIAVAPAARAAAYGSDDTLGVVVPWADHDDTRVPAALRR